MTMATNLKQFFFIKISFLCAVVLAAIYFKYLLQLNHPSQQSLKNKTVLRLFLLRRHKPDDDSSFVTFSEKFILNQVRQKKVIKIDLSGDAEQDSKRFEFIRHEARRLKYTYDTTTVIQVHFNKENTYGQFVYLVNMMVEDQHKRYAFINDDFYIYGEPPPVLNNPLEHDLIKN